MLLVSFSYFIALARTFSTMLNRSVINRHICFISGLRGKAFSLLPISMIDVSYRIFIGDLYQVEEVYLRDFY